MTLFRIYLPVMPHYLHIDKALQYMPLYKWKLHGKKKKKDTWYIKLIFY